MTFKELAEHYLKEIPEGIWVHFNDCEKEDERNEQYLDEDYITEFSSVLNKEVKDYYIDEYGYAVLEVFLKWN